MNRAKRWAAVAALSVVAGARAEVRFVGEGQTYATIDAAINAASDGDTIRVMDSVHTEQNINVSGTDANYLTIEGLGPDTTIVQAHESRSNATDRIFKIDSKTVTIRNMTLRHGYKSGDHGGAIFIYPGTVTVVNCAITLNDTGKHGGGIAGYHKTAYPCSLTLVDCTLQGNAAYALNGNGGAVFLPYYAGSKLVTSNCTFTANSARADGGGIFSEAVMQMVNCTVSHNKGGYYRGGGIFAGWSAGTGCIYNSTVYTNAMISISSAGAAAAAYGGGIHKINNGTLRIDSTVVAKNHLQGTSRNGFDIYLQSGSLVITNSLVSTSVNGSWTGGSNTFGQDPILQPLADNGGPTPTHALGAGSPAIGEGSNPAGLQWDQRGPGFPRTCGGATDIGAYEVYAATARKGTTVFVK